MGMRAAMPSCNIVIFTAVFVLLLVATFYQRDQIMLRLRASEKDNHKAVMNTFRQKDKPFVEDVLSMDPKSMTETEALFKFYKIVSFPVQGVCRVLKRIGGVWLDWPDLPAHAADGDKFVCMDDIILGKPCLIYSFGIANDWTFEDFTDYRGCEIHAHDPTVDFPAERGNNTHFYKKGVSGKKDETTDTLANILAENGHTGSVVEYLKILHN